MVGVGRTVCAEGRVSGSVISGFLLAGLRLPGAGVNTGDGEWQQHTARAQYDRFISRAESYELFERTLSGRGDESLGLRLGTWFPTCSAGPLPMFMAHAATLREGFGRLARYSSLLADDTGVALVLEGRDATLYLRKLASSSPWVQRISEELSFVALYTYLRQLVPASELRQVSFTHGPPGNAPAYNQFLGGEVRFGMPTASLTFPARLLDAMSPQRDPNLDAMLQVIVERYMEAQDEATSVTEQAKTILLRHNAPQRVPLATVADALNMSRRSLQRKLAAERTTYGAVVHNAAGQVAMRLLEQERKCFKEASFLMGFEDPNSFYRALRRWTGLSASAIRARAFRP